MLKQPKVVVIAGLSGVGKSFVIENMIVEYDNYAHFSAGTLIKKRLSNVCRDRLRLLGRNEVLGNQHLLIDQLLIELESIASEKVVLLDAHMLIDTDDEVVEVPLEVFEKVSPAMFLHLHDAPEKIFDRRKNDNSRVRSRRSRAEIDSHQKRSVEIASAYAEHLGVPLFFFKPKDWSDVNLTINTKLDENLKD